ncbi:MAG: hypothetical protein E7600_07755 [Ruminococcaceae bacterium]|nr:hypothetical protein [Oscillospiraceae bacterium]
MFKENEKTQEVPEIKGQTESTNDVHSDQQSMFDADEAFSESMVVEKQDVEINPDQNGNTAVFSFAKDKPEGTEIEHRELSVGELQDTAKDYYNATHSDSIEDKIGDLRKLADEVFDDSNDESFNVDENAVADIFSEESDADRKKREKEEKKRLKEEKKRKKKGVVLDDDIEMLTRTFAEEPLYDSYGDEEVKEYTSVSEVFDEEESSEPKAEEEKDAPIRIVAAKKKEYKSFEAVFGDDEPDEEYVSRNQEADILKGLRSKAIFSMLSVVLTLIVTALCIYFEAASGTNAPHPEVFEPGKYGVTFALSMLQFMFVGIMFNLDGVKRAFRGLRPHRASAEGFCALALIICTLHTVLSCVLVHNSTELRTYCSVGCVSLVVLSVNSFIKAYTTLTSFCIAASKAPKTSTFSLDIHSQEAKCFEKYLDSDSEVITVGKGDFVNGFFKKTYAVPAAMAGTFKISVAIVIVSAVAALIGGIIEGNVYAAVRMFTSVSLAAIPVNALLATAVPFLLASVKAKNTQTAYIGEAACDTYENCSIISFEDTEVFPAKSVKVSSIRTYGSNRIDKVILYMARVFDKVEGPLSYVFANSVQNLEEQEIEAQIVEHFSNGISARIDGKEILVGTDEFLRLYDIETTTDNIDESFVHSLGSIMYLSVDGELAAKFYVKYTMNRNFENILHAFYEAGICVGIKTLDPCITTEFVCANLQGSNYPVSVIKNHPEIAEIQGTKDVDGAVITLSGTHNFLKNFIRLDHLRNIYRTNSIISLVSAIIGMGLAAFLSLSGATTVGMVFIILFQLVWCVPTVLFSFFSK